MSPEADVMVGTLLATAMIAGTWASSVRIVDWLVGEQPLPLRWAGVVIVGITLATLGFFALFFAGAFARYVGAFAPVALGVALNARDRGESLRRALEREREEWGETLAGLHRSPIGYAVAFFAFFVVLRTVWAAINVPIGWDSITYHGPRAALFLQGERFTFPDGPVTWATYRHYFMGSEILWAWALLPFQRDTVVGLMGGVHWWTMALGVWALGESLGLERPTALGLGLAALFVPNAVFWVGTGYVEIPMAALLLCAFALGVAFLKGRHANLLGLALLGLGLAVGIKLLALFSGAVFALFLLSGALSFRDLRSKAALRSALFGALFAVAVIAPYLAFSYVDTGYLIGSFDVELFGVRLGQAHPDASYEGATIAPRGAYTWAGERGVLAKVFRAYGPQRPPKLGRIALVPLLAAIPLALLRLRSAAFVALGLVAAFLAHAGALYLPNVAHVRFNSAGSISRYAFFLVALALPMSAFGASVFPRLLSLVRWATLALFAYLAAIYTTVAWQRFQPREVVLALACLLLSATIAGAGIRRFGRRATPLALVAALAFTMVVQSFADSQRYERRLPRFLPYVWWSAAEALDRPEESARIAVTSGPTHWVSSWFTYYFFGSRFQNEVTYVPISNDGEVRPRRPGYGSRANASFEAWLGRLEAEGVTHVVSFRPRSVEMSWMDRHRGRFRKTHGNRTWGLYEVLPEGNGRDGERGRPP